MAFKAKHWICNCKEKYIISVDFPFCCKCKTESGHLNAFDNMLYNRHPEMLWVDGYFPEKSPEEAHQEAVDNFLQKNKDIL